MSKLETNTIDTVSGTTNLVIGSTNTSTITMPNGALSGQNYPAFHASLSATQTIADVTITKIEFDTELFDTDNCYDNTTNYRFTPTVAGKYFIYTHIDGDTTGTNKTDRVYLYLRKNGTDYSQNFVDFRNNPGKNMSVSTAVILDFNGSTDYVELWVYYESNQHTGVSEVSSSAGTFFGGYRIGA